MPRPGNTRNLPSSSPRIDPSRCDPEPLFRIQVFVSGFPKVLTLWCVECCQGHSVERVVPQSNPNRGAISLKQELIRHGTNAGAVSYNRRFPMLLAQPERLRFEGAHPRPSKEWPHRLWWKNTECNPLLLPGTYRKPSRQGHIARRT